MNKPKLLCLLILIFLGVFACSKKDEQRQNTNAENLQQPQEQHEIKISQSQQQEIEVDDEQLKERFENEKDNTIGDPVYIFKPGKYNMLESSVNIRSQPNLTGSVIGKLELHSEIEIIERAENFQTINGMTHYWYKIKYEDITGYIWGGFISISKEIFEIDGKKMYCYYRVSKLRRDYIGDHISYFGYCYYNLITPNDIFIYINQKRSNVNELEKTSKRYYTSEFWYYCYFYEEDGNIILKLTDNRIAFNTFIINKRGEIIFKDNYLDFK
jgi:hypothetical protein